MPANFSITPLPLVEPVERGSRGRNGPFTATSAQVHVHLPAGPGEGEAFCAIAAYSRRQGNNPPAEIALSLGDALELAQLILRELAKTLQVVLKDGAPTPFHPDTEAVDPYGRL